MCVGAGGWGPSSTASRSYTHARSRAKCKSGLLTLWHDDALASSDIDLTQDHVLGVDANLNGAYSAAVYTRHSHGGAIDAA